MGTSDSTAPGDWQPTVDAIDPAAAATADWACARLAPAEAAALLATLATDDSLDALWNACDALLDEPQRLALDCAAVLPDGHAHADWLIDLLRQATGLPPRAGVGVAPGPEANAIDALLDSGLLRPVDDAAERVALGVAHHRWRDAYVEAKPARMKIVGNLVQLYFRSRAWPTPKNRARPFSPRELPSLVEVVAAIATHGAPLTALTIANSIAERVRKTLGPAVAEAMHRPLVNPPLLADDEAAKIFHAIGLDHWQGTLRGLDRFADAERAVDRAIAITRRLKGNAGSKAESGLLPSKALLASDQGRHAEAERWMWQATAMRRQFVDANDPMLATNDTLLDEIYRRQSKHPQAADAAMRALAILRAGNASPDVLASRAAFAAICQRDAGRLDAALKTGDEAIERSLDAFADDDPTVARRLVGQAKTALRRRHFARALRLLDRAAEIYERRPEVPAFQRAIVANDMAVAYFGLKHFVPALTCAVLSIRRHASCATPNARLLAVAWRNRAAIERAVGDHAAARASLDEAERLSLPSDDAVRASLIARRPDPSPPPPARSLAKWLRCRSMTTLGLSTWSLHRTLARDPSAILDVPAQLRAHGLTDLQICHFQLPSTDAAFLRELRDRIDANGVALDALLIDFGDLAHPTQADADAREIERWLDVAHALDARFVRIAAGDQPPTEESLARSASHLLRLSALGDRVGVRVVTENWKSLLPSSREVLRLIELTGGRVPLCLDFGNWRGPTKYDELAAIARHAVTVHAKCSFDDDGTPDAVDFAHCCGLLRDARFTGTVALIYDSASADEWGMLAVERDLARAALAR